MTLPTALPDFANPESELIEEEDLDEDRDVLQRVLSRLAPADAGILRLRGHGFENKEIAVILELPAPPGTARRTGEGPPARRVLETVSYSAGTPAPRLRLRSMDCRAR